MYDSIWDFPWTQPSGDFTPWFGLLSYDQGPRFTLVDSPDKCSIAVIEPGVTSIGYAAFMGCTHLTKITIPDTVTDIKDMAFAGPTGLTSIDIPKSVTSIDDSNIISQLLGGIPVFVDGENPAYSSDTHGVLFNKDRTVLLAAPAGLTSYEVPAGVTKIERGAFAQCEGLTNISIPESVKRLGSGVFRGYDTLKDVYYSGSEAQWRTVDVEYPTYYTLTNATIHYRSAPSAPEPSGSFTDVPSSAYYAEAVRWAVENGVTNGTAPNIFSPDSDCTRAQIITFLWRACGSPDPRSTVSPFADITPSDYFYKAALWAAENDIVSAADSAFSPGKPCTRAEAVTFQYRAAGKPPVTGSSSFTDVPDSSPYADAVKWAVILIPT